MSVVSLSNSNASECSVPGSVPDNSSSLADLPPALRQINQTYIDHVRRRSLISAADARVWLGSEVTVFLRHDKICVFAIVHDDAVAMADFVTLANATLTVDSIGRDQSNAELGPLPNRRSVHAYLTGRLTEISDLGELPDLDSWSPVVYHPLRNSSFVVGQNAVPIHSATVVRMVPGTVKVWVPQRPELAQ